MPHIILLAFASAGSLAVQLLAVVLVYLVVELPVLSYAVSPDGTAHRVDAFSTWLGTHKIRAIASVAAIVGLVLTSTGSQPSDTDPRTAR